MKIKPKLKKYVKGGEVVEKKKIEDSFVDANNFLKNWQQSPMYNEMLNNSSTGEEYSKISNYRNKSLNLNPVDNLNVEKTLLHNPNTTGFVRKGIPVVNISSDWHNNNEMLSNLKTESDSLKVRLGEIPDYKIPTNFVTPSTIVHEMSHITDWKGLPKTDLQKIKNFSSDRDKNKFSNYVANPSETRSRLNEIRYENSLLKYYNPLTEKINKDQYNNYLKDKSRGNALKDLKNVYSDDEIIDMLNSISENKSSQEQLPMARNGGSIKQFANGGRQPMVGTPQQQQAYQDSMFIHNDGERMRNLLINPSTTESVYANQVSRYYTGNAINQNNPTNQAISRLNTLNGEFPAVESTQRRTFPSGYTSYASLYKKPVQPIILDRPKENITTLNQKQQYLPQSEQHLDFDPIGLKKGTYFTRPRQQQEDRQGSVDYFDNKTGKLLKTKQFGNGGKYEWSKGIDNIQPVTQTNSTSSITTGNKKLSTEELKKAAEYTKQYNQKHLEEEYNNRQSKLKASVDAQKQPLSLKNLQTQTQSTGDKFSLAMNTKYGNPKDYPTLSGYMEGLDYINPAKIIGDMSSGIGSVPQDVKDGNYLKAGMSIGSPLFAGAVAGIGTKGIKPFVNNLTNPLAGTGEIIDNLGNKYLPNAYKLNPFAFKPNSEMMYRGIGKEGMEDALESGVFRAKQNVAPVMDETGRFDMSKQFQGTYYSPKFNTADQYGAGYIAEVPKDATDFRLRYKGKGNKTWSQIADENIPIEKGKILKKDWLKGYKEVPKPQQTFKSEIDWENWVKYKEDFHNNPQVIKHLNDIEQTTKANNTWMKNPDGSAFQGTPEQFVIQQSDNFKKAFGNSKLVNPDGSPTIQYHGSAKKFDAFDESKFQLGDSGYSGRGIYTTPSKNKAESYALSSKSIHKDGNYEPTVYELYGQGNNPISAEDLIKQKKDYDLFNFHRTKDWRGDVPLEEQMLDYDVAIRNQTRGIERVSPWYQADELVFPRNTQLKSAIGNILFDMTNPNIYKALFPAAIGLGAASQIDKKEFGGNIITENDKPVKLGYGGSISYKDFKKKYKDL